MGKISFRGFRNYLHEAHKDVIVRKVKEQLGCDSAEEFFDTLENILACNSGANGGFTGFIYYKETEEFYYNYRGMINRVAEDLAEDIGEDVVTMVRNFNCLGREYFKYSEVAKTMYGNREEGNMQVADAMAKFILEEIAHWFDNYKCA